MSKISDEFYAAFSSMSGSCRTNCECGKEFFHDDERGYDWEDGEIEWLRSKGAVGLGHAVGRLDIGGTLIVPECDCKYAKMARQYESFLKIYPRECMEYIHKVLIGSLDDVLQDAINAAILHPAIKNPESLRTEVHAKMKEFKDSLTRTP